METKISRDNCKNGADTGDPSEAGLTTFAVTAQSSLGAPREVERDFKFPLNCQRHQRCPDEVAKKLKPSILFIE